MFLLEPLKKSNFKVNIKKNTALSTNYSQGIKMYFFSVDLELWNLAVDTVLYYQHREKSENCFLTSMQVETLL